MPWRVGTSRRPHGPAEGRVPSAPCLSRVFSPSGPETSALEDDCGGSTRPLRRRPTCERHGHSSSRRITESFFSRGARPKVYVRTLRGLLRGEQVLWEGKPIQMLHTPGFAPPRPLEVLFIIAAGGPKGIAVTRAVGDGVFGGAMPIGGFTWSIALAFGTVLEDGEDPGAERPLAAAGHAAALWLHYGVLSTASWTRCCRSRAVSGCRPTMRSQPRVATWPCTMGTWCSSTNTIAPTSPGRC